MLHQECHILAIAIAAAAAVAVVVVVAPTAAVVVIAVLSIVTFCPGGGGGSLWYLGGRIGLLSKLKSTPKALISGQESTLI